MSLLPFNPEQYASVPPHVITLTHVPSQMKHCQGINVNPLHFSTPKKNIFISTIFHCMINELISTNWELATSWKKRKIIINIKNYFFEAGIISVYTKVGMHANECKRPAREFSALVHVFVYTCEWVNGCVYLVGCFSSLYIREGI